MHTRVFLAVLVLFSVPCQAQEKQQDIPLGSGGRIVHLHDMQRQGENCYAKRDWIEIKELPSPKAQERINSHIRREMTVGKKLKPSDCPDQFYTNSAAITGIRDKIIGVETWVHFDAEHASGSHIQNCLTYDLQTGQRYQLEDYLSVAGQNFIVQNICKEDGCEKVRKYKADMKDIAQEMDDYTALKNTLYRGPSFCLKNSGIKIEYSGYNGYNEDPVIIPEARIKEFFKLPPEVDLTKTATP